jgi:hypothetical protein
MTYLNRVEANNRSAQIEVVSELFEVHFYDAGSYMGTIEYPDKSIYYVQDAANNWINHIMDVETVKRHKR